MSSIFLVRNSSWNFSPSLKLTQLPIINTTCTAPDLQNYLFLPSPQYSIRLATFAFQSFINLIRLEKDSELKKSCKIFEKFDSFTAPTFFQKFYKFRHSHNTKFTKNYNSFPTTRNKVFEKFYLGHLRKALPALLRGGTMSSPPPVANQADLLLQIGI